MSATQQETTRPGPPTAGTSYPAVIARAIVEEGVTDVFGLMGAGTIQLTHYLTEEGVAIHAARHESGAVGAADGFARVTGDVGVCAVTWGPGLTNTLTALLTASRGRTPLVLVAGDSSTMPVDRSPFAAGTQGLDQARVLAAFDVPVVRARPESAGADVGHAFAQARAASAPVALLLPMEYLGVGAAEAPRSAPLKATAAAVDVGAVDAAARAIAASERLVILAGRGASGASVPEALVRLADQNGALLATSLKGIGLFSGHPYDLGVAGGFSTPLVADLLSQADCVVSFGASMNRFTMKSGALFAGARVIQCDNDPAALGAYCPTDVIVRGDAGAVAEALLERTAERVAPTGFRAAADGAGLSPASLRVDFPDVSEPGALDPRAVCRKLDELLPRERTVVVDCGQLCEYPIESMVFDAPDRLLWMMDFGAIGSGLGPAIGAAIGRSERTTALFVGDGSFFMTMGELDLAVRDQVPLLIVCMNDRAYGSEMYHMREMGLPTDNAFFDTPELDVVARAIGAEAERVTTLEQLDELAPRLQSLRGPLFLDCILTQEFIPTPLREHA